MTSNPSGCILACECWPWVWCPGGDDVSLVEEAIGQMRRLRDVVRETVCLSVLVEDQGFVLEQAAGIHPFRCVANVGIRQPLHASASCKAILAYLPEQERETLLNSISQAPVHTADHYQEGRSHAGIEAGACQPIHASELSSGLRPDGLDELTPRWSTLHWNHLALTQERKLHNEYEPRDRCAGSAASGHGSGRSRGRGSGGVSLLGSGMGAVRWRRIGCCPLRLEPDLLRQRQANQKTVDALNEILKINPKHKFLIRVWPIMGLGDCSANIHTRPRCPLPVQARRAREAAGGNEAADRVGLERRQPAGECLRK